MCGRLAITLSLHTAEPVGLLDFFERSADLCAISGAHVLAQLFWRTEPFFLARHVWRKT